MIFAEIVPVSARSGDNTDELVKVILKYLPYGPQFYDEDTRDGISRSDRLSQS